MLREDEAVRKTGEWLGRREHKKEGKENMNGNKTKKENRN
jgi:hypothetical protein